MLEHIADFTAWPILTGIFIGYIANRIMSGEGKGCCMNLFIGIVGSYAGAIISSLLNIELFGKGYLTNFIFCVIGAIAVLWIWKKRDKLKRNNHQKEGESLIYDTPSF